MSSQENIIDRQIRRWELGKKRKREEQKAKEEEIFPRTIITISRERGSRGSFLAKLLAEKLDYQLIHREIIDFIARDSGVRHRLIESLDERIRSEIELWLEGLLRGKYLNEHDYFLYLMRSVLAIAHHGESVIVGRGANLILGLKNGFHVRVVAPLEKRIENLMKYENLSEAEAKREIKLKDKERKDFIRNFFGRDIGVPSSYDLILNSANFEMEEALELTLKAFESKFRKT
jgi:cytidylate kinase